MRTVAAAKRESIWVDTGPAQPPLPALERAVEADVCVIGAGIVGLTTALLAQEAGLKVVVVEAARVAHGVSGYTTAKISSQHGLIYARLESSFGHDAARLYGRINEGALAWVAERVDRHGIDCDFRRQPSYAYVTSERQRAKVEEEARAAIAAGLPATLVEQTPLPYAIAGAVRFEDQAELHALKYLLALADQLREAGGAIYERSRAIGVDRADPGYTVETESGGHVRADRVVVATHYPFLDRSLSFARLHVERSYAIACRVRGAVPPGIHISADAPTRSIRAIPHGDDELLMVGGEGHKTGSGGDTERRYRALESFAREHWDVESVEYRWSSQDCMTLDGLPYVGQLTPRSQRILMATGFAKWGLTGGTAAATVLTERLLGEAPSPAAELLDPWRPTLLRSAPAFVRHNAETGLHFAGDRLVKRGNPRCTHLGCLLDWNAAERSWDCPCHGSRFAADGSVLEGPAVRPLKLDDRAS